MGMPEQGEIPESLNDCEFYMKTKDNISMFRHLAADAVKIYEKQMRNKSDDKARPNFREGIWYTCMILWGARINSLSFPIGIKDLIGLSQ